MEFNEGEDSLPLMLTIIIPAYNEERFLSKTLLCLNSALSKSKKITKFEIIVVDNASTDNTAKIAKNLGARVIFEPIRQISKVRNRGAESSIGDYLLFVDADTFACEKIIQQAFDLLSSDHAYGGGALIKFDDHQNKFFLGKLIPSFWNWISTTFGYAAGGFLYCTREDFQKVNGFPETMYAGEELGLVRKLKKLNRKSPKKFKIITNPPVITSSRKLSWYGNTQIILYLLLLFFFPLAVRFQKLCGFWYNRPQQ